MINCTISKNIMEQLDQIDLVEYGQDLDAGIIYLDDLLELDIMDEIDLSTKKRESIKWEV